MTNSNETSIDTDDQEAIREKLLWNVKREVKQMMEEAVMKKCIHEENCSITTLCAAVEACLLHGLKRRAVGLFKTTTTTALLQKIAKTCPTAGEVMKIIDEQQRYNDESNHLFNLPRKLSSIAQTSNSAGAEEIRHRSTCSAVHHRYLWLRTALIHRSLHKIVEYIVMNSSKYYEPYALVCNSVQGTILSSLLVGPCALEFTRVKTSDHLWTDPHADELVQRHRMHSHQRNTNHSNTMMMNMNNSHSRKFRPSLQINSKRHASSSVEEAQRTTSVISANPARDYVESLHQNAKSQLIYGKNNVFVQPISGYDPIPGYLSLHHYQYGLTLKWTPNQLMNGYNENSKLSKTTPEGKEEMENNVESPKKFSVYWDYAISINMSSIVYLHCHQYNDGDRVVFIGRDGVQYPPFHIKDKGGHLLAFLTCLESGLAPLGQLDPPLWFEQGQGKIFPKLYRRTEYQSSCSTSSTSADEEKETINGQIQSDKTDGEMSPPTGDYVFRIVFQTDRDTVAASPNTRWQWPSEDQNASSHSSLSPPIIPPTSSIDSFGPTASLDQSETNVEMNGSPNKNISVRTTIESLCETMRRQILSRAFFGWLTYCRHLKTVRTHLTSLVNPMSKMGIDDVFDPNLSLTSDAWAELFLSKQQENLSVDRKEIYRRLYAGGCDPSIRKQVWPFLFSHYSLESTIEERDEIDRKTIERYNTLNNEWRNAETIVTQIDIQNATNRRSSLKKLFNTASITNPTLATTTTTSSAESALASLRNVLASIPEKFALTTTTTFERKDSITSNDVFYEDSVHTVAIPIEEESSCATTPSRERPFLSTSSNQSVLIARTRTQSLIDRASPYNVIETSTEIDEDLDDAMHLKPIQDDQDDVMMTDETEQTEVSAPAPEVTAVTTAADATLSPSSSLTSGTDVYMDAVDILHEDQQNNQSDGSLTPICYGSFSKEIIDAFAANLHRIDKDVARCDRTYSYFTNINNLKKLRNIMCNYVWDNLGTGYIQGMCDLVAPLLVTFDEEVIAYSCFCYLMKRLLPNFPHGAGMDEHLGHMRSLLQILDFELYEHIHRTGDFTHFYFCYRWFLLDFKREFVYDDIFLVWETIGAARRTVSKRFVLFIALAMLKSYRDIILDNRMDFTDIIRFFNEMAERHDARDILRVARELVRELQNLIDNK